MISVSLPIAISFWDILALSHGLMDFITIQLMPPVLNRCRVLEIAHAYVF
jgi:hypothetical protein